MAMIEIHAEGYVEKLWESMASVFDSDAPYFKVFGNAKFYPVVVASQGVEIDQFERLDASIASVMSDFFHKQHVTVQDVGLLTKLMAASDELGASALYDACHRALGETGDKRLSVVATTAEYKKVLQKITACFNAKQPMHCDFSLKVADEVQQGTVAIRVHKLLLSATSDFFHGKFSGSFDNVDEVIPDIGPTVLRALLNFVYTGSCKVSCSELLPISIVADRWGMQVLRDCALHCLAAKWTPCLDTHLWSDCLAEDILKQAVIGTLRQISSISSHYRSAHLAKLSPTVLVDIVRVVWSLQGSTATYAQSSWDSVKQYAASSKFSSLLTASNIGTWPPGVYMWLCGKETWDRVFAADKLSAALKCCSQFPHIMASDLLEEDLPLHRLLAVYKGLKGGSGQAQLNEIFVDPVKSILERNVKQWLRYTNSEEAFVQKVISHIIHSETEKFLECLPISSLTSEHIVRLFNTLYAHVDKTSHVCRKILKQWASGMVLEQGRFDGLCQVWNTKSLLAKDFDYQAETDWSVVIRSLMRSDKDLSIKCLIKEGTWHLQKEALAAVLIEPIMYIPLMLGLSEKDLAVCINILSEVNTGDTVTVKNSLVAVKQAEDLNVGDTLRALPGDEFINSEGTEFYLEAEIGQVTEFYTEKEVKKVNILWKRTGLTCNLARSEWASFYRVVKGKKQESEIKLGANESGQVEMLDADGEARVKFDKHAVWVRRQDFEKVSLVKTDRLDFMQQLVQEWVNKSSDGESAAVQEIDVVLKLFRALGERARQHCFCYFTEVVKTKMAGKDELWGDILSNQLESITIEAAAMTCAKWDVATVSHIAALLGSNIEPSLKSALKSRVQSLTTFGSFSSAVLEDDVWQNTLLLYQNLGTTPFYGALIEEAVCQSALASLKLCVQAFTDPHFEHLQKRIAAATSSHLTATSLSAYLPMIPASLLRMALDTWSEAVPENAMNAVKTWFEVRKPTRAEMPCTRLDNSLELHESLGGSRGSGLPHKVIFSVWNDLKTAELASNADCEMAGAFDICRYILKRGPARAAGLAAEIAVGCLPEAPGAQNLSLLSAESMAAIAQAAMIQGSWTKYMSFALAWSEQVCSRDSDACEDRVLRLSELHGFLALHHKGVCDSFVQGILCLVDTDRAIKMLNKCVERSLPEQHQFLKSVALTYLECKLDALSKSDMLSAVHPVCVSWLVQSFKSYANLDQLLEKWAMAACLDVAGSLADYKCLPPVQWGPMLALLQVIHWVHNSAITADFHQPSKGSITLQEYMKPVVSATTRVLVTGMSAAQECANEATTSCIVLLLHCAWCDKYELHYAALEAASQCFPTLSNSTRFPELPPNIVAQLLTRLADDAAEQALLIWVSGRKAAPDNGSVSSTSNLSDVYDQILFLKESGANARQIVVACAKHILSSTQDVGIQWLSQVEGPLFEAAKLHYISRCKDLVAHPLLSTLTPDALLHIIKELPQSVGIQVLQSWKDRRPGGWADLLPELWDCSNPNEEIVAYVRAHITKDLRRKDSDDYPDEQSSGSPKRRRLSLEQENQLRSQIAQLQSAAMQMQDLAKSMLSSQP